MRFTPVQRKAIYAAVAALNAAAVTFGLLSGEQAAAVGTATISVLSCVLAFANVDNGPDGGAA